MFKFCTQNWVISKSGSIWRSNAGHPKSSIKGGGWQWPASECWWSKAEFIQFIKSILLNYIKFIQQTDAGFPEFTPCVSNRMTKPSEFLINVNNVLFDFADITKPLLKMSWVRVLLRPAVENRVLVFIWTSCCLFNWGVLGNRHRGWENIQVDEWAPKSIPYLG